MILFKYVIFNIFLYNEDILNFTKLSNIITEIEILQYKKKLNLPYTKIQNIYYIKNLKKEIKEILSKLIEIDIYLTNEDINDIKDDILKFNKMLLNEIIAELILKIILILFLYKPLQYIYKIIIKFVKFLKYKNSFLTKNIFNINFILLCCFIFIKIDKSFVILNQSSIKSFVIEYKSEMSNNKRFIFNYFFYSINNFLYIKNNFLKIIIKILFIIFYIYLFYLLYKKIKY